MAEEQGFIIVSVDDDTDNVISDDEDELISEYYGSDIRPDISSDGDLTLDSQFEDSDDSFEEQYQHDIKDESDEDSGVDGDDEDEDDSEVSEEYHLTSNLKRSRTSSVDFSPMNKRRRPSVPDDLLHLKELLEKMERQIFHIYEIVSRIRECCGMSQMKRCVYCDEPLVQKEQATQSQDNPMGTVPQPVAEAEPENLVSDLDIESSGEGAQGIDNVIISSEQPAVDAPLAFLQLVDSTPANYTCGRIYQAVAVENIGPNTVSPPAYIPSNLEVTGIAEASVGNHTLTMNKPTFEENHEEEVTFNPPVIHNFRVPVISEAVLEDDPEIVNYSPAMGNSGGQQNSSSSIRPVSDSEIEEVVLVALPQKSEFIVDGNKQTVYYPAVLGHVVPQDPETRAASISSGTAIEKLVLIEVPVHQLNIVDDNPETLNNPLTPENGGDQEPAAASHVSSESELLGEENNNQIMNNLHVLENYGSQTRPCSVSVHPGLGATPEIIPQIVNCPTSMEHVNDLVLVSDQEEYIGDPRRNIMLPNFHLEIARNKPVPTYAACYLANLIFYEEILLLTSVSGRTSHYAVMDYNKMSAIREYLLTVFTNCDLSEQGKDWMDCLSAISFMIDSLYTEAEIPTDRNVSIPISTGWNISSDDNEGENPSQWLQKVRESVIRESGKFEQNASAKPEGTDNAAIIPGELVYLGDPSRNIQIPYSVLKIAKDQLRPDLSAKFITLHLFPEEILIRSNVYGSLECGLFALDSNRTGALREFLQEIYPEYDLEETGYYWKVCVIAINSCLQTLRQGLRNVTVS